MIFITGCGGSTANDKFVVKVRSTYADKIADNGSIKIIETTENMVSELNKDAGTILFALYTNDAWGIINGVGDIIVEPEHSFTLVLTNELYFISDDPIKLTTGKIYQVDGTHFLPELGELTIFGGGPDCDTAHIVTDVFIYEENGLKGLVSSDGIKLTEPQYEQVCSDYHGKFYITLREEKYGVACSQGEIAPPVFDDTPSILGNGDDGAEVIFASGEINGTWTLYKNGEPIYEDVPNEYIEQVDGAIFIQQGNHLILVDEYLEPIYAFPEDVYFSDNYIGPEGPFSLLGLLPVEKEGLQGLADREGNMLIPFGSYDIYYDTEVGMIYTVSDKVKEYVDIGIDLSKREQKYRDDSIYANLPETIFSQGTSQYKLRLGGWTTCVTDSQQNVNPQGLEDLLRTFS